MKKRFPGPNTAQFGYLSRVRVIWEPIPRQRSTSALRQYPQEGKQGQEAPLVWKQVAEGNAGKWLF